MGMLSLILPSLPLKKPQEEIILVRMREQDSWNLNSNHTPSEECLPADTPLVRDPITGNGIMDPDDFGSFFFQVYNENSLPGIALTPGNYSVSSCNKC